MPTIVVERKTHVHCNIKYYIGTSTIHSYSIVLALRIEHIAMPFLIIIFPSTLPILVFDPYSDLVIKHFIF